ncbi:oxidoreductase [Vibrio lentus]|uniref:oxidoreductase n=1 Tax=Vibrio lentus TaxID=136468 RepID=UPI003D0C98B8
MSIKQGNIVVAGSGGLLGSCLVKKLLEKGYSVIAVDLSESNTINRLSEIGVDYRAYPKLEICTLNITHESDVIRFFEARNDISGVVNTTYPRNKSYGNSLMDVSLASFNENLNLHLGSYFSFMQQCAKYFLRVKKPMSVVNITSVYGVIAPRFDVYQGTKMTMPVEYAAIKSAIIHLTKYFSKFISDSRFRINCVSPGGILDSQPEAFLNSYERYTNGAGMLDVEAVIGSVIFLLNEESKFITGQNLIVDDGFSL